MTRLGVVYHPELLGGWPGSLRRMLLIFRERSLESVGADIIRPAVADSIRRQLRDFGWPIIRGLLGVSPVRYLDERRSLESVGADIIRPAVLLADFQQPGAKRENFRIRFTVYNVEHVPFYRNEVIFGSFRADNIRPYGF